MTMDDGGSGSEGGVDLGGIRYGIGIDLDQLRKDLTDAEALARQRAAVIQGVLNSLSIRAGTAAGQPGAQPGAQPAPGSQSPAAAGPARSANEAARRQLQTDLARSTQAVASVEKSVEQVVTQTVSNVQKAVARGMSAGIGNARSAAERAADETIAALSRGRPVPSGRSGGSPGGTPGPRAFGAPQQGGGSGLGPLTGAQRERLRGLTTRGGSFSEPQNQAIGELLVRGLIDEGQAVRARVNPAFRNQLIEGVQAKLAPGVDLNQITGRATGAQQTRAIPPEQFQGQIAQARALRDLGDRRALDETTEPTGELSAREQGVAYTTRGRQQRVLAQMVRRAQADAARQKREDEKQQRDDEKANPILGPRQAPAQINRNLQRLETTASKQRAAEQQQRDDERDAVRERERTGLARRLQIGRDVDGTDRDDVDPDSVVSRLRKRPWYERFGSPPPPPPPPPNGPSGGGSGPTGPRQQRGVVGSIASVIEPNRDVSALLRVGAAFAGIGLGINVAAGLARQLHKAIADSVDAELNLERAARATTGAFGQQASQAAVAGARTFTADPTTRGTQTEFVQGVTGFKGLGAQYGVTAQQADELTRASGRLAKINSIDLPVALKTVEGIITGNISAGQQYGIQLLDQEDRIIGLDHSYDTLVHTQGLHVTTQQVIEVLLRRISQEQDNAKNSAENLSTSLDRLGRQWEETKQKLGKGAAVTFKGPVDAISAGLEGFNGDDARKRADAIQAQILASRKLLAPSLADRGYDEKGLGGLLRVDGRSVPDFQRDAILKETRAHAEEVARLEQGRNAEQPSGKPILGPQVPNEQTSPLPREKIGEAADAILAADDKRKADAAANPPKPPSVAETLTQNRTEIAAALAIYQQREGQLQQQGEASLGPFGVRGAGFAGRAAAAQAQGEADVLARYRANIAQRAPGLSKEEVAQQAQIAREAPAGEKDVVAAAQARLALLNAQTAQEEVQRANAEASARVQEIQLRNERDRLDAQHELNDLKREELGYAERLSPLMLDQGRAQDQIALAEQHVADIGDRMTVIQNRMADLQDRQTIATRTNLGLQQNLLTAQGAALGPANTLSDTQYKVDEAKAQINARFSNLARGIKPEPGAPSMGSLVRDIVSGTLAQPQAELDAMHARRAVELAQRPVSAEQNKIGLLNVGFEGERRGFENQLIPLAAQQRGAREAEIPYQRELRGIQAQLIPLEAARREEEARTQAVERRLQLAALDRGDALTAAQIGQNTTSQASIDADRMYREAQDKQLGLPANQDPAAQAKAGVELARPARVPATIAGANTGSGGIPVGAAGSSIQVGSITIQIQEVSDLSPDAIGAEVLRRILGGGTQSNGRAPAGTAGTR